MPISAAHVGRTYPATPVYRVSAATVHDFATALQDPALEYQGPEPVAPPTFAMVVEAQAWEALFGDPDLDLALHRVVHGSQSFVWHRPLRAGDQVVGVLAIDQVRVRGAVELVGVTVRVQSVDGEPVCDAASTLVHTRAA